MIKWNRIAALPADGSFVADEKKYGSPLVSHLGENKAHLEMLVAEDEQGFGYYRRVRLATASEKVRWSRSEYTPGARLKDFLDAENTRQVLLEEPVKPEPPPVKYCHHCDGWNENCTHGRYTGPFITLY